MGGKMKLHPEGEDCRHTGPKEPGQHPAASFSAVVGEPQRDKRKEDRKSPKQRIVGKLPHGPVTSSERVEPQEEVPIPTAAYRLAEPRGEKQNAEDCGGGDG